MNGPMDALSSRAAIDGRISERIADLGADPPPVVGDLVRMSLEDLPDREAARAVLSDVGRLCLRRGDRKALADALAASFQVHLLERAVGAGYASSSMLKGLAQIGLGEVDMGVKNVVRARAAGEPLDPLDRVLGEWGLVSAAVKHRDLDLALRFVDGWERGSEALELVGERDRARRARRLMEALTGAADARELDFSSPDLAPEKEDDAAPLLLGVAANAAGPVDFGALDRLGFEDLCRVRAAFPDPASIAALGAADLEDLGGILETWDLATPLKPVAGMLAELDPSSHSRSLMSRLLGCHAYSAVERSGLEGTEAVRRGEAIIWMTDVRGYSALSERVEPEVLFATLSPLFRIMNEELEEAGGMILEFIGDSILVVFGALDEREPSIGEILSATARCLGRLHAFGAMGRLTGREEVRIGVGLNRGDVAIGYLGGLRRCHLSTLGHTVNVAARLEALTRDLPSPVAVGESVFGGGPPDVWSDPTSVTYTLRDLGRRPMKNISSPPRVYGLAPLIPCWVDFVPMGFVADPEPGVVYLDVGNRCEPGIVDHHFAPDLGDSACQVVNERPGLVVDHLAETPSEEVEIRLHEIPDIDCAASFYSACEHLAGRRSSSGGSGAEVREDLLRALSRYIGLIDQGFFPDFERHLDSLYGIFTAHAGLLDAERERWLTDRERLEAGLRVIDAAMFLAEAEEGPTDFARIFEAKPGWFAREREWLRRDRERYLSDRERGCRYEAFVGGLDSPVEGLWLTRPDSTLFKVWARNDPESPSGKGFPFLVVDWSKKDEGRFVISVDPESTFSLRGLGEALERAETDRRREIGQVRPTDHKRPPADNSDPWYFGWGHNYTIIDSPARGTVLGADEVREIHLAWQPPPDDGDGTAGSGYG